MRNKIDVRFLAMNLESLLIATCSSNKPKAAINNIATGFCNNYDQQEWETYRRKFMIGYSLWSKPLQGAQEEISSRDYSLIPLKKPCVLATHFHQKSSHSDVSLQPAVCPLVCNVY